MVNNPELINKFINNINKLDDEIIKEAIQEVESEDMEEDIKILEEQLKTYKRHLEHYEKEDCLTDIYYELKKYPTALENLLKRYKELEEENTRLREDVEGYSGLAKQIQEDYENRIDELENRDRFE